MADAKVKAQSTSAPDQTEETRGTSGGNMGAGKSGKENLGAEKPSDDARMGSEKSDGGGGKPQLRSHDDKSSSRGGGSNQSRGKGGVETDATGGRRAKHNDDEDKYNGRGGGNRGKGS